MLAAAPKLLILDDPTRGIDVGAKAEIQALISDLAGQGIAVILISSDLEEVVEGSHRVIVLRDGRVVGELGGDDLNADDVVAMLARASATDPSGTPAGTPETAA
jgi:ribose transport system ATP-binding protein